MARAPSGARQWGSAWRTPACPAWVSHHLCDEPSASSIPDPTPLRWRVWRYSGAKLCAGDGIGRHCAESGLCQASPDSACWRCFRALLQFGVSMKTSGMIRELYDCPSLHLVRGGPCVRVSLRRIPRQMIPKSGTRAQWRGGRTLCQHGAGPGTDGQAICWICICIVGRMIRSGAGMRT